MLGIILYGLKTDRSMFSRIIFQRQIMEENRRKKREQPRMMIASEDRPKSAARRKQDDAMRSLLPDPAATEGSTKPPPYSEWPPSCRTVDSSNLYIYSHFFLQLYIRYCNFFCENISTEALSQIYLLSAISRKKKAVESKCALIGELDFNVK